jgi:hypothetical protein
MICHIVWAKNHIHARVGVVTPGWVAKNCPQLLVNSECVRNFLKIQLLHDVFLEAECDDCMQELSCCLVGWEELLKKSLQDCLYLAS